jgi:hypothetical protein
MGYTIHYVDAVHSGTRRTVPMVFRDKEDALESACALRRAGFAIAKIEGPNFEMRHATFEAYYSAARYKRPDTGLTDAPEPVARRAEA